MRKGFDRNPAGHPKFSRRQIFFILRRNTKQEAGKSTARLLYFMKSLCALRQISHKTGKNLHCFYMYPKKSASKLFSITKTARLRKFPASVSLFSLYKSRQTNTHFIICCKTPYLLMQPIVFRRTVLHKMLSASCFKNASAALLNTG